MEFILIPFRAPYLRGYDNLVVEKQRILVRRVVIDDIIAVLFKITFTFLNLA